MELVNNLPVILAAAFTIIAGLYGYLNGLPNARVYQNMCVFLVVFYLIGVLIRHTVKEIYEERADKAESEPVTEQLLYAEGLSLGGQDASETGGDGSAAGTEQADSEPDGAPAYEDPAGDGDAPPEYDETGEDEAEAAEFEENGGAA